MKKKDSGEIEWCVCQRCEEAFFVEDAEKDIACPKCGEREDLSFESEQEEEFRGHGATVYGAAT